MEEIFEEIMESNFPQMTLFEMTYKGPNKRDKAYQSLGTTIKFENNQDKEKILSFQRERTITSKGMTRNRHQTATLDARRQ